MRYLLQVRYTGPGPRSGAWLNAQNPGGFMVRENHGTVREAIKEMNRLKGMAVQFLDRDSDWEARVVDSVTGLPPEPAAKPPRGPIVPKPPEPERTDVPAEDDDDGLAFFRKPKAKKKAKKKTKKASD